MCNGVFVATVAIPSRYCAACYALSMPAAARAAPSASGLPARDLPAPKPPRLPVGDVHRDPRRPEGPLLAYAGEHAVAGPGELCGLDPQVLEAAQEVVAPAL